MKIINSGNCSNTTYRFHCTVCNCVYEVAEWELQQSSENTFPRHRYTHCPMCGKKIPACYAGILISTDTHTESITESETKSESTENRCDTCAHLGTRDDSSKFCVVFGKELSDTACDLYKSAETAMTEQAERDKLKEAVNFIQTYCVAHQGNCKGCLFSDNYELGCPLAQLPEDWNTDCLM